VVKNFSMLEVTITPWGNASDFPVYFVVLFIYTDVMSRELVFIKMWGCGKIWVTVMFARVVSETATVCDVKLKDNAWDARGTDTQVSRVKGWITKWTSGGSGAGGQEYCLEN
jgi:hypothetical protein